MTSKIVLLGSFLKYEENYNIIKFQSQKESIKIIALVTENHNISSVDSIPIYESLDEISENYDYIILLEEDSQYYNAIKQIYNIDKPVIPIRALKIQNFNFNKYLKLLKNPPSIISRHCWGGLIYHRLGLKFNTPFINLYLLEKDFISLSKKFEYYMQQDLKYIKDSYDPTLKLKYPIAKLDDLTIFFNHYPSFE